MNEAKILILECDCGNKLEVVSYSDSEATWEVTLVKGVQAVCPCGRDFIVEVNND